MHNSIINKEFNSYNEEGYAIIVKNNINYIVFNVDEDVYINSNVSLFVYAYANGNLQGIKNI